MSKKQHIEATSPVRSARPSRRGLLSALAASVTTLAITGGAMAAPGSIGIPRGDWWRDILFPPVVDVQPNHILEQLVPTRLVSGDREFDGNGPQVNSSVTLRVTPDRRSIVASVFFRAAETKSDWSTTEASWERTIYTAPTGRTIQRIVGAVGEDGTVDGSLSSSVEFISRKAGFQILGPTSDFQAFVDTLLDLIDKIIDVVDRDGTESAEERTYREIEDAIRAGTALLPESENDVHLIAPAAGPVRVFAIVGDTGGDDISKDLNGKDDTRVNSILFKTLRVQLD